MSQQMLCYQQIQLRYDNLINQQRSYFQSYEQNISQSKNPFFGDDLNTTKQSTKNTKEQKDFVESDYPQINKTNFIQLNDQLFISQIKFMDLSSETQSQQQQEYYIKESNQKYKGSSVQLKEYQKYNNITSTEELSLNSQINKQQGFPIEPKELDSKTNNNHQSYKRTKYGQNQIQSFYAKYLKTYFAQQIRKYLPNDKKALTLQIFNKILRQSLKQNKTLYCKIIYLFQDKMNYDKFVQQHNSKYRVSYKLVRQSILTQLQKGQIIQYFPRKGFGQQPQIIKMCEQIKQKQKLESTSKKKK